MLFGDPRGPKFGKPIGARRRSQPAVISKPKPRQSPRDVKKKLPEKQKKSKDENLSYAEAFPEESNDKETLKIINQIEDCKLTVCNCKVSFKDIVGLEYIYIY